MRLFRNPEESSDSELIDSDLDVLNDIDVNLLQNFLDNDRLAVNYSEDESDDSDVDYESEVDSCQSSDFLGISTNSDDNMSDDDSDGKVSNREVKKTSPAAKNSATTAAKNITTQKLTDSQADANEDAIEAKSMLLQLNEDDEDDETVRAIIAAIKKPRNNPPEIKTEDFITDICFHCERDIIAVATITGDVCLYEFSNEANKLLRTIEIHAKACRDVEFSMDGCDLLTCSKDRSIMITDMETEKLKKFYENAHDEAINKLHVIDPNLFATGDDSGTVKLWDLRMKNEIFGLKEVEDYISDMLPNDTGKMLLVTSGDGYLTTLNIGTRKLYVQSEPYEEELTCMNIFRGNSKVVVGSSQGNLYTFNWGQFGYHSDKYPGVKAPIGTMLPITDRIACVAGEEGIIRAVHVAPFRNLGIVGQHNMPIECMDINSTGELIASSSHNNDVRFWNVKYFEDFVDIKYNEKHKPYREKRHNLPSSKFSNASDFFSDLNTNE